MRAEAVRGALCAGWVLICVAAAAAQIGPAISDEQRRVLEQKLPDVTIGEIRSTPVPGWMVTGRASPSAGWAKTSAGST